MIHEVGAFDGVEPLGPLTLAGDGNLYGTTNQGGEFRCGHGLRVAPPNSYAIVHSFDFSDGCEPKAGVIQARDGNFYGTTETGSGWGTVFRMDPAGGVTTLYTFGPVGTGRRA